MADAFGRRCLQLRDVPFDTWTEKVLVLWQPSTEFALLEPKRVMFPEGDPEVEWNPVETVVSHDLPEVAPLVNQFLSDMQFSFADMESALHDLKAGKVSSAKDFGRNWLRNNEEAAQGRLVIYA